MARVYTLEHSGEDADNTIQYYKDLTLTAAQLNTALLDSDFSSAGVMYSDGAGAYQSLSLINGLYENSGFLGINVEATNLFFDVSSGATKINTIQDIDVLASPLFSGLRIAGDIICTGTYNGSSSPGGDLHLQTTTDASKGNYYFDELTTNGLVRTQSGTGELVVDTATYLTGNETITLSGDATGSGTTSIVVTVVDDSHSHTSSTITLASSELSDLTGSLSDELTSLTDAEVQQLQNINTTTISTTQWGYLGNLDQPLTTGSSPQFTNVAVFNDITVVGNVDGRDISVDGTKLDTIETNADVTDATNVAASGAVMDSDISSNGLIARTASGSYSARTITGTSNQVNVSNGDGVSGNPVLSLPQDIDTAANVDFASLETTGAITAGAASWFKSWIYGGSSTSANRWSLTSNGTGDLFINSAQNESIYIRPNSGSNDQWVYNGTSHVTQVYSNAGSEVFRFDQTNGRLAIGTSTNTNELDVVGSSDVSIRALTTLTGGNSAAYYIAQRSKTGAARQWEFGTGLAANDNFDIYDRTAGAFRLSIDSAGQVGIGTTAPENHLHIQDTSGNCILKVDAGGSSVAKLYLTENNANDYGAMMRYDGAANYAYIGTVDFNSDIDHIRFTRASAVTNVLGSLGIGGTHSPDEKLHVEGSMLLDCYNNGGAGGGIFFREGFSSGDANPDNVAIRIRGYRSSGSPDGLELCGYDSVGLRIRQEDVAEFVNNGSAKGLVIGDVAVGLSIPPDDGIYSYGAIASGDNVSYGQVVVGGTGNTWSGVLSIRERTTSPGTTGLNNYAKIYIRDSGGTQYLCVAYDEGASGTFTKYMRLQGTTSGTWSRFTGVF